MVNNAHELKYKVYIINLKYKESLVQTIIT